MGSIISTARTGYSFFCSSGINDDYNTPYTKVPYTNPNRRSFNDRQWQSPRHSSGSDVTDYRRNADCSATVNQTPTVLLKKDYVTNSGLSVTCYIGDVTRAEAEGIVTGEGYGMLEPSMVTKSLCNLAQIDYHALGEIVLAMCGTNNLTHGCVHSLDTRTYGIKLDFKKIFLAVILLFRDARGACDWEGRMIELYMKVLEEAEKNGVKSIAIPLLGSGHRIDPSQWTQLQSGLFSVPTSGPQLVHQRPGRAGAPPCLAVSALVKSLSEHTVHRLHRVLIVSFDPDIHSEIVKQWKDYFAKEAETARTGRKDETQSSAVDTHNKQTHQSYSQSRKPNGGNSARNRCEDEGQHAAVDTHNTQTHQPHSQSRRQNGENSARSRRKDETQSSAVDTHNTQTHQPHSENRRQNGENYARIGREDEAQHAAVDTHKSRRYQPYSLRRQNGGNSESDCGTNKNITYSLAGPESRSSSHSSPTRDSVSPQKSCLQQSQLYHKGRSPHQRKITGLSNSNQMTGYDRQTDANTSNSIQATGYNTSNGGWVGDTSTSIQATGYNTSNGGWTGDTSPSIHVLQYNVPPVDSSQVLLIVDIENHDRHSNSHNSTYNAATNQCSIQNPDSTFSNTHTVEQLWAVTPNVNTTGQFGAVTRETTEEYQSGAKSASNENGNITEDNETEKFKKLNLNGDSKSGSQFAMSNGRSDRQSGDSLQTGNLFGQQVSRSLSSQSADTLQTVDTSGKQSSNIMSIGHTADGSVEGYDGGTRQDEPSTTSISSEPESCVICMDVITNPKTLHKCGHTFCTACIDNCFNFKPVCPTCNTVYGALTGDQPPGSMTDKVVRDISIPGHNGCGAIVIDYSFQDGTQTKDHPNPGKRYHGTRRRAFLPNNSEGKCVLRLLRKAFNQKLTFTIGRSTTTGREDMVTWNDIHHKTNTHGGPTRFGYPDPTYLSRVREELASKGVTEIESQI